MCIAFTTHIPYAAAALFWNSVCGKLYGKHFPRAQWVYLERSTTSMVTALSLPLPHGVAFFAVCYVLKRANATNKTDTLNLSKLAVLCLLYFVENVKKLFFWCVGPLLSSWHKTKSPGMREPQLKNHLHQTGLWASVVHFPDSWLMRVGINKAGDSRWFYSVREKSDCEFV